MISKMHAKCCHHAANTENTHTAAMVSMVLLTVRKHGLMSSSIVIYCLSLHGLSIEAISVRAHGLNL